MKLLWHFKSHFQWGEWIKLQEETSMAQTQAKGSCILRSSKWSCSQLCAGPVCRRTVLVESRGWQHGWFLWWRCRWLLEVRFSTQPPWQHTAYMKEYGKKRESSTTVCVKGQLELPSRVLSVVTASQDGLDGMLLNSGSSEVSGIFSLLSILSLSLVLQSSLSNWKNKQAT